MFARFGRLIGFAGIALFATLGAANAIPFTVTTAIQGGVQFQALPGAPGLQAGGITASFDYTGLLNFSNNASQNSTSAGDLNSSFGFTAVNISNYVGSGTLAGIADFSNVTTFLASSGSASGYQYGSFYTIDLGLLDVGTLLTIRHDDGVSVFQNGVRIGTTTAGPTGAVTQAVILTSTADTFLYYGRQNGTPSILQVQMTGVPEPTSLGLIGLGLLGLGAMARRRRKLGR